MIKRLRAWFASRTGRFVLHDGALAFAAAAAVLEGAHNVDAGVLKAAGLVGLKVLLRLVLPVPAGQQAPAPGLVPYWSSSPNTASGASLNAPVGYVKSTRTIVIPESPGVGRLGRHVEHDEQSRSFRVTPHPAPKTVMWPRHVRPFDQGNLGSCFPPGVQIRMADGSERAIEDVRLGEQVVTAEARIGRVIRTLLRDEEDGLLRLILWGHSHLRLTREHPVLTTRGYVRASDLRIGDEVALPRYLAETADAILTADHVTTASHRLARGHRWSGVQGRRGLRVDAHSLPEKIELTAAFGRLIGLFLAEGNCDSGKAVWSYSLDEKDTLVAETVSILREHGVEPHVRALPVHHGCKVTVHGTAWTRLLSSLCGNGAGMKRLHPTLAAGPRDFLANVLSGWLDGDGCTRKDGSREGVTISHDLALDMYDIAQALGHHPVLVWSESPQNRHARIRRPRWTLTIAPGAGRCRQDDVHVWRKVREVRLEEYVGPVYDLTVEGDHSYVAEGVGVHNCTGNAMAGALSTEPFLHHFAEATAVLLYKAATRLDDVPGVYPPDDTGSSGLAVAKAAVARGWIRSYLHCFTLDDVIAALQDGPVIAGTNWHAGMDTPDPDGLVHVTGTVRGGHEYELVGVDLEARRIHAVNSWGTAWGRSGWFWIGFDDFARLLAEQGDVTVPRL